jgi:hypothetical protein
MLLRLCTSSVRYIANSNESLHKNVLFQQEQHSLLAPHGVLLIGYFSYSLRIIGSDFSNCFFLECLGPHTSDTNWAAIDGLCLSQVKPECILSRDYHMYCIQRFRPSPSEQVRGGGFVKTLVCEECMYYRWSTFFYRSKWIENQKLTTYIVSFFT